MTRSVNRGRAAACDNSRLLAGGEAEVSAGIMKRCQANLTAPLGQKDEYVTTGEAWVGRCR